MRKRSPDAVGAADFPGSPLAVPSSGARHALPSPGAVRAVELQPDLRDCALAWAGFAAAAITILAIVVAI
jgi:hypothetical protein